MFIEGTADCVCVCVWDNRAVLLTGPGRQTGSELWLVERGKQTGSISLWTACSCVPMSTHTHTHMYIQVTYTVPMSPCTVHTRSYIYNYGNTHFLSLIFSCRSHRNRSWSFPCQPNWQGGHTHVHGHRHARTHARTQPNALKRPECQSPCRRMEVEQNRIE